MNSDFETRFPSIKIIKVDCEVKEKGIHHIKNLSFSNENIENNISCGDLNCTSGGIRVFDFVQAMLEKKKLINHLAQYVKVIK